MFRDAGLNNLMVEYMVLKHWRARILHKNKCEIRDVGLNSPERQRAC